MSNFSCQHLQLHVTKISGPPPVMLFCVTPSIKQLYQATDLDRGHQYSPTLINLQWSILDDNDHANL